MKANIHPKYKETTFTCACGNKFTALSTKDNNHVEICSECHPFYTGAQGNKKSRGRVEKFNEKYGLETEEK